MKFILSCCVVFSVLCSALAVAADLPSDKEIVQMLKKRNLVGKASIKDCIQLFGRPVSVVENKDSKVLAFKVSAVVNGLQRAEQQQSSVPLSLSTSTHSVSVSSISSAVASQAKSNEASQATQSQRSSEQNVEFKKSSAGNLKGNKNSVDKIINFTFKNNQLLSYNMASSH